MEIAGNAGYDLEVSLRGRLNDQTKNGNPELGKLINTPKSVSRQIIYILGEAAGPRSPD
jgi:hypothetical protein